MAGLQYSNTSSRELGMIQACEDDLNFPALGISGNSTLLAQFTRNMNTWYQKIITMIFECQDAWNWDDINQTDYPIASADLVAGQQDYELPLTLGALKIQRLDISFDGITWQKCSPFDVQETLQPLDTTSVGVNFSKTNPKYDIRANSIFIYPIPDANVTAGLKIYFSRGPLEFATTDTTKAPGIDYAFHRMIAVGAMVEYCKPKNLPQKADLQQELMDYEARLKQYYSRKDEDRRWQVTSAVTDTDYA